jgi:DNA invertase Pin-like site-specific DNA recombinase
MERPELKRALEAIRAGQVRRLWVWRLDRLTRSGIVDTLEVLQELRRCGCECASVADGFALDGPASDVIVAVLAWAASLERAKIEENLAAARERLAAQGRTWGRPPVIGDARVELIMAMHASGATVSEIARESKISRTHIARLLRKNGH